MKHIYLILLVFFLGISNLHAQSSDADSLKEENLRLKNDSTRLARENFELKKENDYLRQTLNIFQPIKTANKLRINFNLIACEGDADEQTVTLTFNLVNADVDKKIMFDQATIIDVQGNEHQTFQIMVGSESMQSELFTNTPLKATLKFKGVPSSALILKLIDIKASVAGEVFPYPKLEFQLKDIPILWK